MGDALTMELVCQVCQVVFWVFGSGDLYNSGSSEFVCHRCLEVKRG